MDDVGMKGTLDARPIHRVYVDGFYMDQTDVTNGQFAEFAKATGYVTGAERKPRAEDFPGAPPENLVAGAIILLTGAYSVVRGGECAILAVMKEFAIPAVKAAIFRLREIPSEGVWL